MVQTKNAHTQCTTKEMIMLWVSKQMHKQWVATELHKWWTAQEVHRWWAVKEILMWWAAKEMLMWWAAKEMPKQAAKKSGAVEERIQQLKDLFMQQKMGGRFLAITLGTLPTGR